MNKKYICYDHSYILFESLFLTLIYYDIRQNSYYDVSCTSKPYISGILW